MTPGEPSWPRARWIRVVALLFVAHLFLAWALAERTMRPVRQPAQTAPVALLTLPSANEAVHRHPAVAGATLFALVDPRGFSGMAWLRIEPREALLTDWQEPEFWLPPDPARLGLPFKRFIQTNAPQLTSAATVPPFQRSPISLPRSTPPAQSGFLVTGDLAKRPLLTPPAVPVWPLAGSVLRSTHVNIAVDASGDVFSAVVAPERSSGDAAADQKALELARQLRFGPAPERTPASPIGEGLTWGTVVFRWQPVAPAITNGVPRL